MVRALGFTVTLMSIRGYARHRAERGFIGGTKTAVKKAVDAGRISIVNGMIEAETADKEWESATSIGHRRVTG